MLEYRQDDERLDPFARRLQAYLRATLQMEITLKPWEQARELPVHLARRYHFFTGAIADHPCLFMATTDGVEATPKEIARHVELVGAGFEGLVIFAAPVVSSTLRARLIAHRVAFAIPGNQLYIPYLAMDLREHFRAKERKHVDNLSPVAQAVFFHHLLRRGHERPTPTMLADALGYSAMSIGRAFDELVLHNLAQVERSGREKILQFRADRRTLLEASRTLLRSPVRGVHAVRFKNAKPPMPLAGESALAELTGLAPPRLKTYAILATDWRDYFKRHDIEDFHYEYESEALIETWRYDPRTLSDGTTVDPLSLYARYWDDNDERVAQAADALLETIPW